ncbi:tetratricopeptide repeat protein [Undibacterium cyanobacteriorum]|uniref:Tetratricopeptide repeat protein n=1 Tax=Undibacterium cyanobacteriorum TaxID=3073561 RepID=A0ABY9RKA1_9BURK|nr:tetratricopeptide repeat protein [Undibacterium sp. 20NA77.5]WMW81652.1 tetratricopeptide repeat protein [Undibacterium sp. 20NA77.5]
MFKFLRQILSPADPSSHPQPVDEGGTSKTLAVSTEQLYQDAQTSFERGDTVSALEKFLKVFSQDPQHVRSATMLGFLYRERGNLSQAKHYLTKALELDAQLADVNYMLGSIAAQENQAERMVELFRCSLALDPHQEHLYLEFSFALFQLGRGSDSIELLERGLQEFPQHLGMLQYLGNIHLHLRHYQEAHDVYLQAIAQLPTSVELRYNLSVSCMILALFDEALEHLSHIQSLQPDHVNANFEEGMLRLQRGEFERGWRQFQWRWKTPALASIQFKTDKPIWDGSQDLQGKTILVLSEQGFGDTLQFCRLIPVLKEKGARVVFVVLPLLMELMRQVPGVDILLRNDDPLPPFDYYCELMSLPVGLHLTTANIPSAQSYLSCPAPSLEKWRGRVKQQGIGLRIGVVWSGNLHHVNNHMRSIPFESIRDLFELPAQFTVLQKDLSAEERAVLAELKHVHFYGDEVGDFTDSAALVELMDVIVTVDTSIAHLAGAMGKPTWVLLSFLPDWRWMLNSDKSPWYDSVRLFRQGVWRPWQETITEVKTALKVLMGAKH